MDCAVITLKVEACKDTPELLWVCVCEKEEKPQGCVRKKGLCCIENWFMLVMYRIQHSVWDGMMGRFIAGHSLHIRAQKCVWQEDESEATRVFLLRLNALLL